MILGMSVPTFTTFHVILSLVGIGAGLVVLIGMFASKKLEAWTALFLGTTVLTSVTGYFFPRDQILPSHIVGAVSLVVLAVALYALYARHLAARWRWIYVVSAVASLYLNVFVLVVQAFAKLEPLKAIAPTQAEPPFVIAQGVVLLLYIALGILAVKKFHPRAGT